MADLTTTRAKIQDALDEADTALQVRTTSQRIADLQGKLDAMTAERDALQKKIDAVRAAIG